ncbi:MAG: caspase family protein [Dehalococcoidia bacterium]
MKPEVVRRALLVGINKYEDPRNNLKGCVNDVLMMGKVLMENYGFNKNDIRLLVDRRATTANIRTRLRWLTAGAAPGSTLVFHFSGHGSQVRDRSGDELDDQMDEILCPYDLDWDDPFTDDELAKAIAGVPDGVNFTLVLDCCHSGTGTREFFKEPATGRESLSRYLVPPPDIAFRQAGGVEVPDHPAPERGVNMVGQALAPAKRRHFGTALLDQNAILISGCRSDQTSADAWIDNDNRGALTYSLYTTLKEARWAISYGDLIERAGGYLEQNGYEQVPQLECPAARNTWSFLGNSEQRGPAVFPGVSAVSREPEGAGVVDTSTRVFFIHGIGDHQAGYSDRWRKAYNNYLGLPVENFIEVLWDDVFDARSMARAPGAKGAALPAVPALTAKEAELAARLSRDIRGLLDARLSILPAGGGGGAERGFSFGGLTGAISGAVDRVGDVAGFFLNFDEIIGDFTKYLASPGVRKAVDARLSRVLVPVLQAGFPAVVISHSWGTVVGHHTLRDLGQAPVKLHVTLGSPLWMQVVRDILDFDERRAGFERWMNIDAEGDLIGGRLHPKYAVDNDYLVPSAGSGNAHGSYFRAENVLVQRDLVGKAISDL